MSERPPQPRPAYPADEERFISERADQVRALASTDEERAVVDRIAAGEQLTAEEQDRLPALLERFETKVYVLAKPEHAPDAKRVLITSDNPGSFAAMQPLVRALLADPRCSAVDAVVSGVAGRDFLDQFPEFEQVRKEGTLLADVLQETAEEPVDVIIASVSVQDGPESLALYGGKGNLHAKKTFFLFEGYGGLGGAFSRGEPSNMEQVDGIFCNDPLAKEIVRHYLPDYPEEKIHATGTPLLEILELDKAEEYRAAVRTELGIGKEAFTVAFLGDTSSDYASLPNAEPDINGKTFSMTLESVEAFAKEHAARETALIFRPHPRDPKKEELRTLAEEKSEGPLLVKDGAALPLNGMLYAADVVASIMSTESFFAPARGRHSIFLAYDAPGMGGDAFRHGYGDELMEKIGRMPGVAIVHSETELREALARFSAEPQPAPMPGGEVSRSILDIALGE